MPRTRCIRSAPTARARRSSTRAAWPICWSSCEHARHALAAYEADRLPKTAEIVRNNRKGGPEGVIDEVERRAPDGFADIDDVLSHAEREAIVKGYAQLAGFAKEQVNRGGRTRRRALPEAERTRPRTSRERRDCRVARRNFTPGRSQNRA